MIKVKEENIVFLSISTYAGMAIGATHYYGRLRSYVLGGDFDVTCALTQKEVDRFNRWTKLLYKKGEQSTRISSERKVIAAAKKQFKIHFPKATVLVLGRACIVDPQKILVGPKEFKAKINVLVKKYDKLDWDAEEDRVEIEKIEQKWETLWPRKYT